uniref:Uncharacterized protein n=1 Tax=Panagrolaimus sp. ES5 TaxID=591445 RepID=A0AC34GAG9_9BILA
MTEKENEFIELEELDQLKRSGVSEVYKEMSVIQNNINAMNRESKFVDTEIDYIDKEIEKIEIAMKLHAESGECFLINGRDNLSAPLETTSCNRKNESPEIIVIKEILKPINENEKIDESW